MRKANLNFIVDAIAFVAFVLLASTGLLMEFLLPSESGHFSRLWGMNRHDWGEVHFWIAIVLLICIAVHLLLHWRWVVTMVKGKVSQKTKGRTVIAVVSLLVLFGLAAAPFLGTIKISETPADLPHRGKNASHEESDMPQIDGTVTLEEIQKQTGVSPAVILQELGLPPETPVDATLGRLRKEHSFRIHTVRDIVRKFQDKKPAKGKTKESQ